MEFDIQEGRASHKIPFGHRLKGKVRANKLHFSSPPERNGGHWVGVFALDTSKKEVTTGIFKWAGDKNGATCAYQAIIKRLKRG